MKIHDDIEGWLAAAVTDALTPEEKQAWAQHLAECPACRALLAEEQKMNTILKDTLEKARPDAQFEQRMVRAFRTTEGEANWRERLGQGLVALLRMRPAQAVLAVLGLMALVQGGALLTGERFQAPSLGQPMAVTADASRGPAQRELTVMAGLFKNATSSNVSGGENSYAGEKSVTVGSVSNGYVTSAIQSDIAPMSSASPGAELDYGRNTEGEHNLNPALTVDMSNSLADSSGAPGGASGTKLNDAAVNPPSVTYGYPVYGGSIYAGVWTNKSTAAKAAPGAAPEAAASAGLVADDAVAPTGVAAVPEAAVDPRKLIRDANLELEVANYEQAESTITTLAAGDQGYVATQNSERGPNGKLQGQIVVKVVPEKLDALLAQLRGLGDLKNQSLGTQDVTKEYTDTAARLRNAQTMENRLLDLLATKTGKVSEMLEVERELGRVRGQIEQMQGQLKLYDSLVAYATVTVQMREKDLNQPAEYQQTERATLAFFAPDVEAAFAQAKQIASAAKGQVAQSQLTRDERGRQEATLSFTVEPEQAAAVLGQLKALGRVQSFNDQTERVARDGSGSSDTAKVEREPVQVDVSIGPDEERTVQQASVSVQADAVEAKAVQIKQAAAAAGATVANATFDRAADGAEEARMTLRLPLRSFPALLEQIKALGEVKDFTESRQDNAAGDSAPTEISLQIFRPADLVADENGLSATLRRTLGQGVAVLLWSVRMIGVSLAFLAPWVVVLGLGGWLLFRRRASRKA